MARKLKIDFTNVEEFVKCEEGQHVVRIKEIEEKEAESGNEMLVVSFEVTKGDSKGAVVYNRFVLIEKALWRLKALLTAVGIKVPEGKLNVDLDALIGKSLIIEVRHEEYNGSMQARIDEYKKLVGGKASAKDEEDEEEEDEEEEEAPPVKKSKKPPAKPPAKKKPPVEEEDDDDDEDDEEEEDEPPVKKKKKAATPPAKAKPKAKPKKKAVEEDEDEDWDEDDE